MNQWKDFPQFKFWIQICDFTFGKNFWGDFFEVTKLTSYILDQVCHIPDLIGHQLSVIFLRVLLEKKLALHMASAVMQILGLQTLLTVVTEVFCVYFPFS